MLINSVFDTIIYFLERHVWPIWPNNFAVFSFSDWSGALDTASNFVVKSFSGISNIFPVDLFLGVILLIFISEAVLIGVKVVFWVINVFRGSGA